MWKSTGEAARFNTGDAITQAMMRRQWWLGQKD
jgi:hypothetical protein